MVRSYKYMAFKLRLFLFVALKDINCKPKTSSFGRSIKRKKDSDFVSNQIHRTRKKLRVNGSSINESIHQLSDIPKTSLQSYSNTKSVKKEENIDKDTLMTKSVEAEQIPNENQLESNILGSLKTFITKTSKIKLNSKTIKGNEKQVLRQPHTISNTVSKQVHCKSNTTKSIQKPLKNKVVPSYGVGTYYLKFNKEKILTEGRFNYKFQKLVTDVKNMNLPSVRWKIKVIIRQNKISAITFTNKQELERSVTFASEKDKYKLLIDNKSAYLLGSPETIDSPEDIEILLEILEQLDSDSPIILYR